MRRTAVLGAVLAAIAVLPAAAAAQLGPFGVPGVPTRRATVPVAGLRLFNPPMMGSFGAPVRVLAFVDYQCPYSARIYRTIRDTAVAMPRAMQVSLLHYPLDSCNPAVRSAMHPQACLGARAAICAQRQGRFWEMSDQLFRLGRAIDPVTVDGAARAVQLDLAGFAGCMRSQLPDHHIAQDLAVAQQVPVQGTPLLIINDGTHPGAMQAQQFDMVVRHLAAGGSW